VPKITDLFVYGTLTDPACRQRVLGHSPATIRAFLKNYARRDGKYPYLVATEGEEASGWILCDLGKDDFQKLDDYEAATPRWFEGAMRRLYRREPVAVVTSDGRSVRCWVYLPNLADWPVGWW